jgi:Fe-S-cluster containining protein
MCCNGVLFGNVELQPRDDAQRLAALGMDLFRKGRKQCFNQPCACFDGKWCGIYADRPNRCRSFECRLLQRVQVGKTTSDAALKTIAEARRCADRVRDLVRQLGHTDERMPLNRRYSAIMSQPLDLASDDEETTERRSELMLAVHELTQILGQDFL